MTMAKVKQESRIWFCPLVIRQEGEDFLVGREDISSYVQLPEVGVRIIRVLETGITVAEATDMLTNEYGEEVPVAEFLESLIENRFVQRVDDIILETPQKQRSHFEKVPLERLAWLYSVPAFWVYGLLASFVLAMMFIRPQYFPKAKDFFPFTSYALCVVLSVLMTAVTLFIHELSHLAAARSIGVQGRISLSNRLIFLVAQTDISNVWNQPREKRYIPYFAGMALDIVQIFLWLMVLIIRDYNILPVPGFFYGMAKQQILALFMSIAWQFRFYMQTDIYYVITNFLGYRNLIGDTRDYIYSTLRRLVGKTPVESGLSKREKRIRMFYLPFFIGGIGVTLAIFFGFTVPIIINGLTGSIKSMVQNLHANPGRFLDGAAFLVVFGLQYGLLLTVIVKRYWSYWRQRIQRNAGSPA